MPGPEECFESKQALNARFRESNRNISPIEKDYHTNLKECKNDILFIAYVWRTSRIPFNWLNCICCIPLSIFTNASRVMSISSNCKSRTRAVCPILRDFLILLIFWPMVFPVSSFILTCNIAAPFWTNISPFFFILRGSMCYNGTNTSPLLNYTMGTQYKTNKRRLENGTFWKKKRSERTKTD